MLDLNWGQITVLVVDDSAFMRKLLKSTLGAFGIKKVVDVADCATAIERLKLSRTDPVEAMLGQVDLILSDYMMPGIDGNLFLRWIRTGDGAPDRFVPFIMVTGAASKDVVQEARDAGVSGVLSKPFSSNSLAQSMLQVINSNRAFVLAQGYFGPDRRRVSQFRKEERRITTPEQIQTVKPDTQLDTLDDNMREVRFQVENRLRAVLGPEAMKKPVEFDPQVIRAIEARIYDLVYDYAAWVKKYIKSMSKSLAALKPSAERLPENRKHVANFNKIAHELHGQGGTFGYDLITEFGVSLYRATANPDMRISANSCDLIRAHIDAIRTVFTNRVKGDGGEVGAQLLTEIAQAVRKYT